MSLALRVGLGRYSSSKMGIPYEIMAAVRDGDTQTVLRFLDEGGDVNAYNYLGWNLLTRSVRHSNVELCRELLARGADPNRREREHGTCSPLCMAILGAEGGISEPFPRLVATWSATPSGRLFQILVESGADLNAFTYIGWGGNFISYAHEGRGSLLARMLIYFGKREYVSGRGREKDEDDHALLLEIVTALLRAGAREHSIIEYQASGEMHGVSWCLGQARELDSELDEYDEHFIKARELIVGIAVDGSFKRFMRRPHRSILRLRSLVSRGHATPKKWSPRGYDRRAIEFLVKPDVPKEIVWNILSFWRASE